MSIKQGNILYGKNNTNKIFNTFIKKLKNTI